MSEKPTDYESMGCDELLREMARLTSERDRLQSQVGSSTTVPPAQQTQEQAMEREGDLLKRLGDLIVRKGCGGQ